MNYLCFSAEAEAPAGYYLMKLWNPIEIEFNKIHNAKEYCSEIDSICIVFICTREELVAKGYYPERKYVSYKNKFADYRMHIPFLGFVNGTVLQQYDICFDKIKEALMDIQRKIPTFNAAKLIEDIGRIFNAEKENLL